MFQPGTASAYVPLEAETGLSLETECCFVDTRLLVRASAVNSLFGTELRLSDG